ncbi:unnamed protein product (mitochondrion) [Plasmodiophora brassicae]|uniref:AAA+ ATPase domain-containing protein n=1 Tax=Plasmodiophora brassicae TaxID=37360 RepID=A0A0G4ISP8_PLABS|nr:hypothetical protein PBRA_006273 [Plasmodiophora brassicae]SPQ96020.1 unnamed protein product [Plasmodiophora brassicae]
MGKGRRRSGGGRRSSEVGVVVVDDDEYDVLNPRPAVVSGERAATAADGNAAVVCSVSALESAPAKWRAVASTMTQALVLCNATACPRLALIMPFGIPCQICHATVNKAHGYVPRHYLGDNASMTGTVEPLSTSPSLALSVRAEPLDGVVNDDLRNHALRSAMSEIYVIQGQIVSVDVLGRAFHYRVDVQDPRPENAQPVYRLGTCTTITIAVGPCDSSAAGGVDPPDEMPADAFPGVGGLAVELMSIWQYASLCLYKTERLEHIGIAASCRGLLLYGPPGTGKSLIVRRLAAAMSATLLTVNGADCLSGAVGESERALRRIFRDAASRRPSIVFLDEIDLLCPAASKDDGGMHQRLTFTLTSLFDTLQRSVLVIAATNRPDSVSGLLRRPGRFDREVLIGVPNAADRLAILKAILNAQVGGRLSDVSDQDLQKIADDAHGFVGADLRALVQEAALSALRSGGDTPVITSANLKRALNVIRPSALRETVVEVPKVFWDDIGGQEAAKAALREVVEWPLRHPQAFARLGVRPPRGVLLYGPPGCSKTMMARALATESSLNFIAVKGPELLSKWVGDSEKAVRDVFVKARASAPTIIFFDEIDSIASARAGMGGDSSSSSGVGDRVLSQLLSELDGLGSFGAAPVIVVAATNRPDALDPAILRPGRIDRLCYVALPDRTARVQIARLHASKYAWKEPVDAEAVADRTQGFSGAEIGALCREAALKALEEHDFSNAGGMPFIAQRHIEAALREARPRIAPETIAYYEAFAAGR